MWCRVVSKYKRFSSLLFQKDTTSIFCDIFLSLIDKRPLLNYQIEPKYQMEPTT